MHEETLCHERPPSWARPRDRRHARAQGRRVIVLKRMTVDKYTSFAKRKNRVDKADANNLEKLGKPLKDGHLGGQKGSQIPLEGRIAWNVGTSCSIWASFIVGRIAIHRPLECDDLSSLSFIVAAA